MLKYWFPNIIFYKRNQEQWLIQGQKLGKYQISLKHIILSQKGRKCSKKDRRCQTDRKTSYREIPTGHSFNMEEKQSSSLSKKSSKCRRNNGIRKSPLEKHHNNDTEDAKTVY